MSATHVPLFPIIVSHIQCENYWTIKNDLISWIYEFQKTDEGTIKSNRGGWQSKEDHFYFDPSFARYYDYIVRHILSSTPFPNTKVILSNMWININRKGDYNASHDHPRSLLSGVFWVKTPKDCGGIVFESPMEFNYSFLYEKAHPQLKELNFNNSKHFSPLEGSILLFPSNLRHHVEPNQSEEDRISIAFNLFLDQ